MASWKQPVRQAPCAGRSAPQRSIFVFTPHELLEPAPLTCGGCPDDPHLGALAVCLVKRCVTASGSACCLKHGS